MTPDPAPDDPHPAVWLRHWVCYTTPKNRHLVAALIQNEAMTSDWFTSAGFPAGTDAEYYGHFNPFVPKTPLDRQTRVWANDWDWNAYKAYNGL